MKRMVFAWVRLFAVLLLLTVPFMRAVRARQVNSTLLISGVIDSIDDTTIIVGGISFDVDDTELHEDLVVGRLVEIEAVLVDETWVASKVVELDDDEYLEDKDYEDEVESGDYYEISGQITEVGDGYIVIAGQTILVENSEFVVGDLVIVLVKEDGDARYAEYIEDYNEDDVAADCVLPAGWVTYTVQDGDTFSDIVDRADADYDDVENANCLDDDNFIVAGTVIYVPNEPVPPAADDVNDDNVNDDESDDDDDHQDDVNDDESDDDDDQNADEHEDESDDDDQNADEHEDESDDDGGESE